MTYTIVEHRHRFAAWSASRAASVSTCRFSVVKGCRIIERIGLRDLQGMPALLPPAETFDERHNQWCCDAQDRARGLRIRGFKYGVAAKLVNVYLKCTFVCAGHDTHPRVRALHPPLDRALLRELRERDIGSQRAQWSTALAHGWSKLTFPEYQNVIDAVKATLPNDPLWHIEEYWPGHQ